MARRAPWLFVAALAAVLACGPSSSSSPPATSQDVTFDTGAFTVQPGDAFECFYTAVTTEKELSVNGASGAQAAGGHHITVYYTDQTEPVGHHPCVDAEMISWHQIGAAGGNKEGIVNLPDGYATRVPAGKQIVTQSHYINATGAPASVHDTVTIHVLDPSQVKAYANTFYMGDATFTLAPRAITKSVTECSVPQDVSVLLLLGHMHELGSHYTLDQIDAQGAISSTIYDTDWNPSFVAHPPVHRFDPATPLLLKAGTRLRQTCTWNNSTGDALGFPREMCILFTYYVPDAGWVDCATKSVTP